MATGTVMETVNIQGFTDEGRKLELSLTKEFEVDGYSWQEDMHPDGVGYYETFFEASDEELNDAVEEWYSSLSIDDIDFLFWFSGLLKEDEKIVKAELLQ